MDAREVRHVGSQPGRVALGERERFGFHGDPETLGLGIPRAADRDFAAEWMPAEPFDHVEIRITGGRRCLEVDRREFERFFGDALEMEADLESSDLDRRQIEGALAASALQFVEVEDPPEIERIGAAELEIQFRVFDLDGPDPTGGRHRVHRDADDDLRGLQDAAAALAFFGFEFEAGDLDAAAQRVE